MYNILSLLLGFFVVVLLGFRTGIAGLLVSSTIMVIRIKGISIKAMQFLFLTGAMFLIIINTPIGETIFGYMMERNENDTFDNEDYIRFKQFAYYTQDHFKSIGEWFWGSGMAAPGTKYFNYFDYFDSLVDPNGVTSRAQWRDWGLVGLSWIMGIPLFLILLFFIVYMIFKKTDKDHYYISCLYLFMLMTGVTTVEFYRNGAFVFHALLAYLMGQLKNRKIYENRYYNSAIGK